MKKNGILLIFGLLALLLCGCKEDGELRHNTEKTTNVSASYDVRGYFAVIDEPVVVPDGLIVQLDLQIRLKTRPEQTPRLHLFKNEGGTSKTFRKIEFSEEGDRQFRLRGKRAAIYQPGSYTPVISVPGPMLAGLEEMEIEASLRIDTRGFDPDIIFFAVVLVLSVFGYFLFFNTKLKNLLPVKIIAYINTLIVALSAFGLVLLIIDELGLALLEWGVRFQPFLALRDIMSVQPVSYTLFIMNLVLLAAGLWQTYGVFDRFADGKEELSRAIKSVKVLAIILLFLFNLLLTATQILFYNGYIGALADYDFNVETISVLLVLILTLVMIAIAGKRLESVVSSLRHELASQAFSKYFARAMLFGFFVIMSETMVTKAVFLLILIPATSNFVIKGIQTIVFGKVSSERGFRKMKLENLIEIDLGNYKELGFYFLVSSIVTSVMFIQFFSSPYPPTTGAYPMTVSMNLFYSVDILLIVWGLLSFSKWSPMLIAAGIMVQCLTRFALPVLYPFTVVPAAYPPGQNLFTVVSQYLFVHDLIIIVGILQLWVFISFYASVKAQKNMDEYENGVAHRSAEKAFLFEFIAKRSTMVMIGVTLGYLLLRITQVAVADSHTGSAGPAGEQGIVALIIYFVQILIVVCLQLIAMRRDPFKEVGRMIEEKEGKEGFGRHSNNVRWLKYFGWRHNGFVFRVEWVYLILFIVFWGLLGYFTFM